MVVDRDIFGDVLGCETYVEDRTIYKVLWTEREKQ
jgi:hypothetical protein